MNDNEIIFAYTRAQAIADGLLVDVSELAKERGFSVPVAVTAELYRGFLVPAEDAKDLGQTTEGRVFDMLTVLYFEIRKNRKRCEIPIKVTFLMSEKHIAKPDLKCVVNGGDDGKPVVTIMLKGQD